MQLTTPARSQLQEALERLAPHDHLCLIYDTREEQLAAAVPFIRMGLHRGEKCIYIFDDNDASAVRRAMTEGGVPVDIAGRAGALVLAAKQDAYLKEGHFDPDRMIAFLKEQTDTAVADGFSALRVTGEMTWQLGGDPGAERLLEYESKLNLFLPENQCLAICQYNRERFSPEVILGVIRTHPIVIYGGSLCQNFHYWPPEEFLSNQPAREVERLLRIIRDRERMEEDLRESCAGTCPDRDLGTVPPPERRSGCRDCLTQVGLLEELRLQSQRMEAMAHLAGGVADEFSSLLTIMLGYTQMLIDGLPAANPLRELGQEVLKAGRDASNLTQALLTFSRRREVHPVEVDLNALLAEIEEKVRSAAGDEVEVFTVLGPRLWAVKADPELIEQVVVDLVAASSAELKPGAAVTLQTSNTELKPDYARNRPDVRPGEYVRLAVSDNGPGLNPEQSVRIFEPFPFRPGGPGLGVSAAYGVVKQHGGSLSVESAPGAGTVFTVLLPRAE